MTMVLPTFSEKKSRASRRLTLKLKV